MQFLMWLGRFLEPEDVCPLTQESSEYETDSDDEINARQLLKPVFVTKAEREVCAQAIMPSQTLYIHC